MTAGPYFYFKEFLEHLMHDSYPDLDITRLGNILINVEDKTAAHQDVENYCDAIDKFWGQAMTLRDPETVEKDSTKCCDRAEYRTQLGSLRSGYHQLINGIVSDSPEDGFCCGR